MHAVSLPPLLLSVVLLLTAACGPIEFTPPPGDTPGDQPGGPGVPGVGERIPLGEITPPEGGTFFDLIAPPLPAGAKAVPLRARLDSGTHKFEVSSVHVTDGTWAGTPVTAGSYTLTYLDQAGEDTPFTEAVQIAEGEAVHVVVGSVWVGPSSAVFEERVTAEALSYRISDGVHTLKQVTAPANAVIDLPQGGWQWHGQTSGAEFEPLTFEVGPDILHAAWGSIFVRKAPTRIVDIQAADGRTLFGNTQDLTEYLLPARSQVEGCHVYRGVIDQLTIRQITLCTDVDPHFELSAH
jgi:hypothetical protein